MRELLDADSSWRGAFDCITISCDPGDLQSFPFDDMRSLQARHHKFVIRMRASDEKMKKRISQRFPTNFMLSEVSLRYEHERFSESLRNEDLAFLAKVTELSILAESELELDLQYLPSLQRLSLDCSNTRVWKSLQCHPLEYLTLTRVTPGIMELQQPISAKHVHVEAYGWWKLERFVAARLFPDAEHLSLIGVENITRPFLLELDSMSKLRHLEANLKCEVIAAHPMHLSSLTISRSEQVPKTITASMLKCGRVSIAVQMLSALRHVAFASIVLDDSLLQFPRTISIELDDHSSSAHKIDFVSLHVLLNRCVASGCTTLLQPLHLVVFEMLCCRYDRVLLQRLLCESPDVSQFQWYEMLRKSNHREDVIFHMLESPQPIDWSQVIRYDTYPCAFEFLLSERPELAKRTFGVEKTTLLHKVCQYQGPRFSKEERRDRRFCLNYDEPNAGTEAVDNSIIMSRELIKHGADPSAQDVHGRVAFHYLLELKELVDQNNGTFNSFLEA